MKDLDPDAKSGVPHLAKPEQMATLKVGPVGKHEGGRGGEDFSWIFKDAICSMREGLKKERRSPLCSRSVWREITLFSPPVNDHEKAQIHMLSHTQKQVVYYIIMCRQKK